jgi:hypothetical protein
MVEKKEGFLEQDVDIGYRGSREAIKSTIWPGSVELHGHPQMALPGFFFIQRSFMDTENLIKCEQKLLSILLLDLPSLKIWMEDVGKLTSEKFTERHKSIVDAIESVYLYSSGLLNIDTYENFLKQKSKDINFINAQRIVFRAAEVQVADPANLLMLKSQVERNYEEEQSKNIIIKLSENRKRLGLYQALGMALDEYAKIKKENEETFTVVPACAIQPVKIEWLWQDRFPLGMLSLVCGEGGMSKSTFTFDMAARVSTGADFADKSKAPIGSVMIISGEDDPAAVIRPRLDVANADVSKIFIYTPGKDYFTLSDLPALKNRLNSIPDCKMVVIDPIGAFMGRADSHRDAEVRGVLAPLATLAQEKNIAIILVAHFNKGGQGRSANDRIMGSVGFRNACRAVYLVMEDKNTGQRLLLPNKNNLAGDIKGLSYQIETVEHPTAGKQIRIKWEGPVEITAEQLLRDQQGEEDTDRQEAKVWLKEELAGGAKNANTIQKDAKSIGISESTLRRAKQDLGIKSVKSCYSGAWQWVLPERYNPMQDQALSEMCEQQLKEFDPDDLGTIIT